MLTLSMIVKNEEKHLAECLNSVKDIVDEIVIVDTGSDDNTMKIAKEYGARIYNYKWGNDFSAARNYALNKSSGSWILYLDADERLTPASVKELKKIIGNKAERAYYCTIHNIDEVRNRPSVMKYVRLFPHSPQIKFTGKVHEQIEPSLLENNYKVYESRIEIIHVGYSLPETELKNKAKRNLELLLDEYDILKSSYIAYQLGQTYGILEMDDKASEYLSISLKDEKLKKEYRSLAFRYLSVKEAERRNWDKALDFINKSLKCDPRQPLPLLILAKIKAHQGDIKSAEECCLKAYEANKEFLGREKNSFQVMLLDEGVIVRECMNIALLINNINLFNFFFNEIEISKNGEPGKYFKLVEMLLNNRPVIDDGVCIEEISFENIDLIINLLNKYTGSGKESLFSSLNNNFPDNPYIKLNFGLYLSEQNRFSEAAEQLECSYSLKKDPSIIFYLVSNYLQSYDFEKIMPIIEKAEAEYQKQPEISARLKLLKQKVEPLISQTS